MDEELGVPNIHCISSVAPSQDEQILEKSRCPVCTPSYRILDYQER